MYGYCKLKKNSDVFHIMTCPEWVALATSRAQGLSICEGRHLFQPKSVGQTHKCWRDKHTA